MVTNTYLPNVGGVAESVKTFTEEYRRQGEEVLVICPEFEGAPDKEEGVVRVPAIQNFNGSDFSVRLPIPLYLHDTLDEYQPEIIHTHHPFLMGDTAARMAGSRGLPLIFTHHTMYEDYLHYFPPGDSAKLKRFVIEMATGFANLCDHVIAPSESIGEILRARGVESPISAVPTGIRLADFSKGSGEAFRKDLGIPDRAFVIGHLGRLAPEKNLEFLAEAVSEYMLDQPNAHFLVAGKGESEETIRDIFYSEGLSERLHLAGVVKEQRKTDCYHAMDVFVFASHTETQGMVLAESLACGVPLIAVDAPGAREVVEDGVNGILVKEDRPSLIVEALKRIGSMNDGEKKDLGEASLKTVQPYSLESTAKKQLEIYRTLIGESFEKHDLESTVWARSIEQIRVEWDLFVRTAAAMGTVIQSENSESEEE
ncbi:MAG: glycosyltransferase [Candidatus Omnitrophica bacterium]|nr:glycosyltransferase [Candidatus Omnitrophota bacterium]